MLLDKINSNDEKSHNHRNSNKTIHHANHPDDTYAPAWKTMEYMTLGNTLELYRSILDVKEKQLISKHFGINQTTVFENYIDTVRNIRNICAHGSVMYDVRLYHRIKRGPAGKLTPSETSRLGGAIKVIAFLLGTISANRRHDMIVSLNDAYMRCINKNIILKEVIEKASDMLWDLPSISQLEK